jgi:hypothetical protein
LVTPGTSWLNQELPGLNQFKAKTSWFNQEERIFSKPVTKPITREIKNLKTRNQNREPYSWQVPGSILFRKKIKSNFLNRKIGNQIEPLDAI